MVISALWNIDRYLVFRLNYFHLIYLVSALCFSSLVIGESESIFISGYGESEKSARKDAKQQLALNILSLIQVKETASFMKKGNAIDLIYSQESQIESLPVQIQTLELESVDCDKSPCRYNFRIKKTPWTNKLSHDIENIHSQSNHTLNIRKQLGAKA